MPRTVTLSSPYTVTFCSGPARSATFCPPRTTRLVENACTYSEEVAERHHDILVVTATSNEVVLVNRLGVAVKE